MEKFIYAIKYGNQNLFKVGASRNPFQRLRSLQPYVDHNMKLKAISKEPTCNWREAERRLHNRLRNSKKRGEIFECTIQRIVNNSENLMIILRG